MRPPCARVACIAYICYTISTLFINSELPKCPSLPAQEAVHALERLVAAGMRVALCLRSHRSFLWMCVCLAGFSIRKDLLGVTSIVRALGLEPACYDRLLDFFHSPALDLNKLTLAWCALVFRLHPGILRVNTRPVLVADGIKVAKAGRKVPGVKKLHQESDSNNKPEFIFGHSCQAVAVLTQAL